jgi:hypothetical protein
MDHFEKYAGKKGQKRLITAIRDDFGGHFGKNAAENALKICSEVMALLKSGTVRGRFYTLRNRWQQRGAALRPAKTT